MRNHARILAVALALSASGCSLMVDPAKNDPLETAEGFCNSIQDTLDRLGCDVFGQGWGRSDPSQADALLTSLRGNCDTLKAAVDAGRFTYDSSAAQGCIDALEAGGCKGIFPGGGPPFPAACTRAVKGAVAPGAACTFWNGYQGGTGFTLNECAQGSTCRYSDSNVCQSTCAFDSDVGGPCGRGNYGCRSNLYCGSDLKCYAYLGVGASCTGADQYHCDVSYTYCNGSTCQSLPYAGSVSAAVYPWCQPSAYLPSGGTPGVSACVSRPWPGVGTCSSMIPCTAGSYCNYTLSVCANYSPEGGRCDSGYYCSSPPYGAVSLYCDVSYTCRRYPTTRLGQGADCYYLGSSYCADGLFCDTSNVLGGGAYTCQPVQTSGSCTGAWDMCAPGYECRYIGAQADNYCVPLVGLGAACDTNNGPMCLPGTWCKTATGVGPGTCSAYPGPGQPCANSGMAQCARGSYPVLGATCVCTGFLGEGAPCGADYECGSTVTGMRCVTGYCQPFACYTPIGWYAGTGGGT